MWPNYFKIAARTEDAPYPAPAFRRFRKFILEITIGQKIRRVFGVAAVLTAFSKEEAEAG